MDKVVFGKLLVLLFFFMSISKERIGKLKMGFSSLVYILGSSVCLCICTVPETRWVYGTVRPDIVSESISRLC